jgi:hypothetical protein
MPRTDQELAQEELNNRQYMYGGLGPFSRFLSGQRREIIRPETTQVSGFAVGPTGVEYITQTTPAKYGPVEYDSSYSPVRRGLSAIGDMLGEAPSFLGFRGPDEQVEAIQGVGSSLRDALFGTAEYMSEQARAAASGGEYFDPETGRTVAFDPTITMFGGNPAEGAVMGSGFRMGRRAAIAERMPKYQAMRDATVQRLKDKGVMSLDEYERALLDGVPEDPKITYSIADSGSNSSYITLQKTTDYNDDYGVLDYDEYTIRFSDHSLPKKHSFGRNIFNVSEDYYDETINGKSAQDAINYVDKLVPDKDTRSAFLEADLYSGGRTGTGIAAGSSLGQLLQEQFPKEATRAQGLTQEPTLLDREQIRES